MIPWLEMMRAILLRGLAGAIGVALFAALTAGQRERLPGPESSPVLHQAISNAVAKYKIPGIAAAWIENGQLRGLDSFGVRDAKSGDPVDANTIFEAGSLGETVYAYAVLRLSTDGRINIGAPLPSFFPLPYVRHMDATSSTSPTESLSDPRFNQVTAIRVMNHTSGLPDWAQGQHMHFLAQPEQKWSYSNEGYIYLQAVVEHITGEPFDDFLAREILGPARMIHSSFVWRDADAADRAKGYDRSGAPVESRRASRPAAAATFSTSIRDYSQFVRYLLASAPAQRAHESAVSLMLKPTVSVSDAAPLAWGLGVGLEKTGDDIFFVQRGASPGFRSFLLASRKTGSAIVILANSDNGLDAVPDIVAATLHGDHPVLKSAFLRVQ